jgi:hypothetical protein
MLAPETIRVWKQIGLGHILLSPSWNSPVPTQSLPIKTSGDHVSQSISDPVQSFASTLYQPLHHYYARLTFPVRLVWTYFELDDDHRGTPDLARVQLWDSILKAKNWKSPDIAFWPLCIGPSAEPPPEPAGQNSLHSMAEPHEDALASCFRRLIALFQPAYVLCFGQSGHDLLRDIYAPHPFPDATRFLFLPGAEEMLPDNKRVKRQVWDVLRPIQI